MGGISGDPFAGGLYWDAEYNSGEGAWVVTQSMVGTFRRCPKMTQYKYAERLKPRGVESKPLTRGTWLHDLLEVKYSGGDWRARHKQLTNVYNEMSDDDKETLGDLPREIKMLIRGYEWHYSDWDWTVLDTEFILDMPMDNGQVFRCKIDALIEDEYGLAIVDHKSHQTLPDITFRLRDVQSVVYLKAAQYHGINTQRFIWNYIRTKAPTVPQLVDVHRSPRLSRRAIETDYPTYSAALRRYGLDRAPYMQTLKYLHSQKWSPDRVQSSLFYRRDTLEKNPHVVNQVWRELQHTSDRMAVYPWNDVDSVERVTDRSCRWRCSFESLCTAELMGSNADLIRRKQYRTGDPLDYYDPKELES